MPNTLCDGPATPRFTPVPLANGRPWTDLAGAPLSSEMQAVVAEAPRGEAVAWGIALRIDGALVVAQDPLEVPLEPARGEWLVFLHTSDRRPLEQDAHGLISPMRGEGMLGERAATYVVRYEDGSEEALPIRRRREIGAFSRRWGENCFEAVAQHKPHPVRPNYQQPAQAWGRGETRVEAADDDAWQNWLWAWRNPHPERTIVGLRLEPGEGVVVLSAVSCGNVAAHPLRWEPRRKASLTLPEGVALDPALDDDGLLAQIRLDMGQVISARRRPVYPNATWTETTNNQLPDVAEREVLIEYTAHPDAAFHFWEGDPVPVSAVVGGKSSALVPVTPATQRVTLRAVTREDRRPVAVKLHVHGEAGEYLA
ncbi:MAG: hypothetical protein GX649_12350, partial [Chloroflexi bacterium]|nr:hypothetical protein [Chloroflexota bacterium]